MSNDTKRISIVDDNPDTHRNYAKILQDKAEEDEAIVAFPRKQSASSTDKPEVDLVSAFSGFGLHSCASIAGGMGGTLTCQSEGAGSGARFGLRVPIGNPEGVEDHA